ncbi:hypothetical protein VTJ83DRAFT_4077 [Remersonia thermophila]|uniref:WW domain-containing protein n=1 Tax=Remersonia thermophila TaxID=72144 RepID=A0ABR4DFX8_9PEZI
MSSTSDAPPSYEEAIYGGPNSLPQEPRNGIPLHARRSMEDEMRPLPTGWVREFDPETQHQFFVDTLSTPPRSVWHHPYDDDMYLSSLPANEREEIRRMHSGLARRPSAADIAAEDTDSDADSDADEAPGPDGIPAPQRRPNPQQSQEHNVSAIARGLGRKLKDRLTGTTHEQRSAERIRRAAAERELYRQHCILRRAMLEAMRTAKPVSIGRDANRVHLFLEPPGHTFPGVVDVKRLGPYLSEVVYDVDGPRPGPHGRYLRPEAEMYGMGYGGYGCGRWAGGRWDRPALPYNRRLGPGFGGGFGFPMIMPLAGGLMLGGMLGQGI